MNLSNLWVIVKESWHAAVHGVTKNQTRLSDWTEGWQSLKNFIFNVEILTKHVINIRSLCFVLELMKLKVFILKICMSFYLAVVPLLSPRDCSDSCLFSWWCYRTISSSAALFSFFLQAFFPVNFLFASGGQSIGASASALDLLINNQDWFPLGLPGSISL